MNILIILLLSAISAILYRAGGMGKYKTAKPTWIPKAMRNTKTRDLGCPLVMVLALYFLGIRAEWYIYLLSFLLTFGALTTYFKRWFGFANYWFAGFVVGLGLLPFIFSIAWYLILARALLLAVLWGAWCKLHTKDTTEELFRGATIIATLLLV